VTTMSSLWKLKKIIPLNEKKKKFWKEVRELYKMLLERSQ